MKLYTGDTYYNKTTQKLVEFVAMDEETHVVSVTDQHSWFSEDMPLSDFLADFELSVAGAANG